LFSTRALCVGVGASGAEDAIVRALASTGAGGPGAAGAACLAVSGAEPEGAAVAEAGVGGGALSAGWAVGGTAACGSWVTALGASAAAARSALGWIRDERVTAKATAPATRTSEIADTPNARDRLPADECPDIVADSGAWVDGIGPDGRDDATRGGPPVVVSTPCDREGSMMRVEGAPETRPRRGASAAAKARALSKRCSRSAAIARCTMS